MRALFGAYSGKLYQVRNAANATKDILTLTPGGFADGPSQDAFCAGTTCVTTVLYDQSGHGNDLWYQGSTMVPASTSSRAATATTESLMLSGHKVYSLYINPNNSYWVDASKSGIATGSQPEGMYMVTSGKHFNSGCCFDYGNSEVGRTADGPGTMDAINLSSITRLGHRSRQWSVGVGRSRIRALLPDGGRVEESERSHPDEHVCHRRAQEQRDDGIRPARWQRAVREPEHVLQRRPPRGGWSPMKKQGAIVLGSGGDCCKPGGGANLSAGTFYEGCHRHRLSVGRDRRGGAG